MPVVSLWAVGGGRRNVAPPLASRAIHCSENWLRGFALRTTNGSGGEPCYAGALALKVKECLFLAQGKAPAMSTGQLRPAPANLPMQAQVDPCWQICWGQHQHQNAHTLLGPVLPCLLSTRVTLGYLRPRVTLGQG